MFRASLPRNPWRVNWFICHSEVLWLPAEGLESLARMRLLNSSLTFNVTNLMRNNESQYVTAVDKPINTPMISWQASTKCSIQFDQTARESDKCETSPCCSAVSALLTNPLPDCSNYLPLLPHPLTHSGSQYFTSLFGPDPLPSRSSGD